MADRTNSLIRAETVYGAPIPKAPFSDRTSALKWAQENRGTFPGLRMVRYSDAGKRTIWKDPGEDEHGG